MRQKRYHVERVLTENEVIRVFVENFIGDNTFQLPGASRETGRKYTFTKLSSGAVELSVMNMVYGKKKRRFG